MIHPLHEAPLGGLSAGTQLAAEDLRSGDVVSERRVVLDQQAFDRFAQLTGDAHPIHYDVEHARSKGLRAPIAHGLLITAVTALGATALSARLADSMIAMLGLQVRFVAPIFVGDTVTLSMRVVDVVPKRDGRSVTSFEVDVLGADGKPRAHITQHYMLRTSLKATAP